MLLWESGDRLATIELLAVLVGPFGLGTLPQG
jgi:hypothetical protein